MDFGSSTPLIQQAFPSVSDWWLLAIQRWGQGTVLACSLLAIFPIEIAALIRRVLGSAAAMLKKIMMSVGFLWDKNTFFFASSVQEDDPIPEHGLPENIGVGGQIAGIVVGGVSIWLIFVLPWDWYPTPLGQIENAIGVWDDSHAGTLEVIGGLAATLGYVLLALLCVSLWGMGILFTAPLTFPLPWALASLCLLFGENLTGILIRSILALGLLLGGVAVIATS